jgi:hypothetical protein
MPAVNELGEDIGRISLSPNIGYEKSRLEAAFWIQKIQIRRGTDPMQTTSADTP